MGAMAINNQLENEGFDVGSEEYYTELIGEFVRVPAEVYRIFC
jgi:hypothetical protein